MTVQKRVLQRVHIHEVCSNPFGLRYFEVEYNGERLRIRVWNPDDIEIIESNLDVLLNVFIYPYKWMIDGQSGVVDSFDSLIRL